MVTADSGAAELLISQTDRILASHRFTHRSPKTSETEFRVINGSSPATLLLADVVIRRTEVWMVEDIEELSPKTKLHPLLDEIVAEAQCPPG